jgi:hypothetical protein
MSVHHQIKGLNMLSIVYITKSLQLVISKHVVSDCRKLKMSSNHKSDVAQISSKNGKEKTIQKSL